MNTDHPFRNLNVERDVLNAIRELSDPCHESLIAIYNALSSKIQSHGYLCTETMEFITSHNDQVVELIERDYEQQQEELALFHSKPAKGTV